MDERERMYLRLLCQAAAIIRASPPSIGRLRQWVDDVQTALLFLDNRQNARLKYSNRGARKHSMEPTDKLHGN